MHLSEYEITEMPANLLPTALLTYLHLDITNLSDGDALLKIFNYLKNKGLAVAITTDDQLLHESPHLRHTTAQIQTLDSPALYQATDPNPSHALARAALLSTIPITTNNNTWR